MAQTPQGVRQAIRSGAAHITHTSGLCPGHLQANLVILPSLFAADFDRFVAANSKACPLLYRSRCGETGAPPLALDSDIRSDVPQYKVFVDGILKMETADITKYWTGDLVAYYFGCSFTFENALQTAGVPLRNVEQGRNVSMFSTNVPCVPAGPFHAHMVVSMRPIPSSMVDLATSATAPLIRAHGAPIHVGDPSAIGIRDVMRPDFGDAVAFSEGDTPVFWACGVTSAMAAISARPPLCITHSPGCMFICDVQESDPLVQCSNVEHRLRRLEEVILRDDGHRGVAHLFVPGDFTAAATALRDAQCVGIVTGFPCNVAHQPPHETDGPPGAATLCDILVRLDKAVVVIGEPMVLELVGCCVEDRNKVQFVVYPPPDAVTAEQFLAQYHIDHLLAIERSSRASDGKYYTMRARDITSFCAPVDDLFEAAVKMRVLSTGIGDGGNEIGMKKVQEQVCRYIPNGPTICSATPTTYLIASGVSNWGGFALAAALGLLTGELAAASHVLQVDGQRERLARLVAKGVRDGVTQKEELSVDGLRFDEAHRSLLMTLLDVMPL
eukprot:GGOE01065455.1.p1 GENE.GGOE01065455.1~~GGOE01065455.1.p1  ORF type:complete len:566 (+),score=115.60 GGOE01065455.1:36-1700(+)